MKAHGHIEVDALAESELGISSVPQGDVGTTLGRWVNDRLGAIWPWDQPASQPATEPIPAPGRGARRTTFSRPIEPDVERPVSMVAAIAMRDLLATWRAAERDFAVTAEDSPEWPHLNARLISLRVAYRRLFDEANEPR